MIDLQSAVLLMRLILSPVLIACATLIGRRWGPSVSGWFTGFPFISAPISLVLAIQSGKEYAAEAAVGTLGGQSCVCVFAVVYLFTSRKFNWRLSSVTSILFFLFAAYGWKSFSPGLPVSLAVLLLITFFSLWLSNVSDETTGNKQTSWWDLPARMALACAMVFTLTGVSGLIGAKWSGILSALPVFGLILASFTHMQEGSGAVGKLLRGSILGSFGIAIFYLIVAIFLPLTGSLWVYVFAGIGSLIVNGISLRMIQTRERKLLI